MTATVPVAASVAGSVRKAIVFVWSSGSKPAPSSQFVTWIVPFVKTIAVSTRETID